MRLLFAIILENEEKQSHSHIVADRKSTRLNSSHGYISYAVFCLKKKKNIIRAPSNESHHRASSACPGRHRRLSRSEFCVGRRTRFRLSCGAALLPYTQTSLPLYS